MESYDHSAEIIEKILETTKRLNIPYTFKASFDKANRTSVNGRRGLGIDKSLQIFERLKFMYRKDINVTTDVHESAQIKDVGAVVDIIQIPAFLCRQTDLLLAAAKTGKWVNVKKGQFMAPWNMSSVVEKIKAENNDKIILTERGSSFGYNNLVVDFRSLVIMKELGVKVVFDGTHSVQLPSANGGSSGGDRKMVPPLCRAAMAVGVDGLFIETHQNPDLSPSDGPNMIPLAGMKDFLETMKKIHSLD